MKKLYFIFLLIPIVLFNCSDNPENDVGIDEYGYVKFVDISKKAEWIKTDLETVVIINSQEELDSYIGMEGNTSLRINFDKRTILKVTNLATKGISSKHLKIRHIKDNVYHMDAFVELNTSDEESDFEWVVEVPKLLKDAIVEYTITYVRI